MTNDQLDNCIIWSIDITNRKQAEAVCRLICEMGGSIEGDWMALADNELIRLAQEIWDQMRRQVKQKATVQ